MAYALDIPPRAADEFRRRFPSVPFDSFAAVLCSYAIAKSEPERTLAAIRDELDEVAERAWEFASYLRRISLEAGDQIYAQMALRGYGAQMLDQLLRDADSFGGCAEMARRQVEAGVSDGRPVAPETRLVRGLARLLAAHGEQVSAKPSGSLCIAFDLAAEVAVGAGLMKHKPKDIRGMVASALKGLEKE